MARYDSYYYRTFHALVRGMLRATLRLQATGVDRVPIDGAAIIAANHQSYLDPLLIGAVIPRELQFMARDSLFKQPLFARLIRSLNAFPVKRGSADLTAIKLSLRLLKDGKALLLFPEATRSADGRIRSMQAGVVTLARRSGAPIVPAALEGAFRVWPRTARLPRPARVWVAIGEPITGDRLKDLDDEAAAALLTTEVRRLHNGLRSRAGYAPFEYAEGGAAMGGDPAPGASG